MATSVEIRLRVPSTVYAPAKSSNGNFIRTPAKTTSTQQSVRLGKHVVVSLIKVTLPLGTFPPGGYVEYEVETEGESPSISQALRNRCKRVSLRGDSKLLFFVPFVQHDKTVELFYLSCRRIRRSRNDAVRAMASECRRRLNEKRGLPSLLVLGGDQIYADDVDDRTLQHIKEVRLALFNNKSPARKRNLFVEEARLTSKDCDNHLVDFEEIACLYLISWSTELAEGRIAQDIKQEVSEWETVLAHVPTYMIFDDHDVTDDWFIDTRWRENVLSTNTGKRYVDDALAAYFIFQGWGNDPNQFPKEDVESFGSWLLQRSTSSHAPVPIIDEATWTFLIPCDWLIICLDCRTKRLKSEEWSWFEYQESTAKPYRARALEPIIVAPSELAIARGIAQSSGAFQIARAVVVVNTPIFGLPVVGAVQERWRQISALSSRPYATNLRLDPESWDIDPASWVELVQNFLSTLNINKWVILSGDVHHSFVVEGEFRTPAGTAVKCLQVTASPTNNETDYIHNMTLLDQLTLKGLHRPIYQAIWQPQSGVAKGTAPMTSEYEFLKLVKLISQKRGQAPYVKQWKGIVPVPGRNAVSTWNVYANVKLSQAAVDVAIVNMRGESTQQFLWS